MDNVDYDQWAQYLAARLADYGIKDGLVLELGCGTGTLTELLARAGYDMIGVDNSQEMKRGWNPDWISFIFCRICRNLNCTAQ